MGVERKYVDSKERLNLVIEGKIIRILSPEKVLLSVGEIDGVKLGMIFSIYEVGEEIIDPDTDISLGNIEYKKADVLIDNTMEKMSIAKSLSRRRLSSSFISSYAALGASFSVMNPLEALPLPIQEKDINPISSPSDPYIRVGDYVRQRNPSTGTVTETTETSVPT